MTSQANFGVDPKLTSILGASYTSTERALCELVDNAWDADANLVRITLPTPLTDDPIVIEDDGSGMTEVEVREIYLRIANDRLSRSRDERTSGKRRRVKGRKGIGKFAGLAAAGSMTFESTAGGVRTSVEIRRALLLDHHGYRDLETIDLPISATPTAAGHGSKVTLRKLDHTRRFPSPDVLKGLLVRVYGREEDFRILVNDERLEVADVGGTPHVVEFFNPDVGPVKVTWIIADKPLRKGEVGFAFRVAGKIVGPPSLCGLDEVEDIPEKVRQRIYGEIEADGLHSHVTADWGNLVEDSIPLQDIKARVRADSEAHLRDVCKTEVAQAQARLRREYQRRIEMLPEHRRKNAANAVERVIQKWFPEGDAKVRILVDLVLDALEKDDYFSICEALVNARGSDVAAIAECLHEFGLVDMAMMVQQAKTRMFVLDEIERLARSDTTLEAEIHRAIENNLWIFGSQYGLLASNKTLGRIISDYVGEKHKRKRLAHRPDLFLSQAHKGPKLLIEFKRPSQSVGRQAESQAREYRDDLTPSNGPMEILVLGGSVDKSMSAVYETRDIVFRSYAHVIGNARSEIEWLLSELSTTRSEPRRLAPEISDELSHR
ncbi:MAG: ATP-binding protein [Phycisphaeraceae bacterium]